MRKITICLVTVFFLIKVVPVLAATTCKSQTDCQSGYVCVYSDENNSFGVCARIYSGVTVTPTIKATTVPTKAVPTITCKSLWWFDNSNRVCIQQKFCGTYMYQGLQTFTTQAECTDALLKIKTTATLTIVKKCDLKKCGDANCDGVINSMDMLVWSSENKNSVRRSADFNGDGSVDIKDYDVWKNGLVYGCGKITPTPGVTTLTPLPTTYCRSGYYGGTYGPICNGSDLYNYYLKFFCADNTSGMVGDITQKTCYNKNDLVNMANKFCSTHVLCSNPTPTVAVTTTLPPRPTGIWGCNNKGDADGDGKVTLRDFAIWKYEYSSGKISKSDFSCDRTVDLNDYEIWKKAFFESRNLMVTTNN